jgi:non-specific serine/threonine protein kinase
MIGETVSHYRVLRRLGAGGMGEVYEAEDSRLGRHVALKFLSDALNNDAQALERFQREARATSSLDHPNICTIYEIGEFSGRAYIAMQMLEGQTLREYIAGKPFDLESTLEMAFADFRRSRCCSSSMFPGRSGPARGPVCGRAMFC